MVHYPRIQSVISSLLQTQCDAPGVESQAFSNPQTITAAVEPSDSIVIMDHPYSTAEVDDQSLQFGQSLNAVFCMTVTDL